MKKQYPSEKLTTLCLWSGPRNVSTALMYSFAQRSDTRVIDEPLYGHYLRVTGVEHPGRDEVLADMNLDGDQTMRDLLSTPGDRPVLFLKQMAHHLVDIDRSFLEKTINLLLIRNPEDMLPSLTLQLPDAGLRDTGLELQCELMDEFHRLGQRSPVLDSRELLLNPQAVLATVCEEIGIGADPAMLHWKAGKRPEDGIWASHWYHNVHRSTGFQPYKRNTGPFPDHLRPLLDECRPFYEKLYAHAIRAPS